MTNTTNDLPARVEALKAHIALGSVRPEALEGRTLIWDTGLRREVDALIDLFYDDIGRIKLLPLKSLFDLFLIKVLVVDRGTAGLGDPAAFVGEALRPPSGGAGAGPGGGSASWNAPLVRGQSSPFESLRVSGGEGAAERTGNLSDAERRFLAQMGLESLPAGADLSDRSADRSAASGSGPTASRGGTTEFAPGAKPVPELGVLEYLSEMLVRFLYVRELVRSAVSFDFLYSILEETRERQRFQNLFESSRQLGDNALFVTGMFPKASARRSVFGPTRTSYTIRRGVMRKRPSDVMGLNRRFDREHFSELGRRYYRVAAGEDLAEVVGQREVLLRLSERFDYYREALAQVSQRYILGFDMNVIANKMLDALNRYRRSGDAAEMESTRKYAALLRVDRNRMPFPAGKAPS